MNAVTICEKKASKIFMRKAENCTVKIISEQRSLLSAMDEIIPVIATVTAEGISMTNI